MSAVGAGWLAEQRWFAAKDDAGREPGEAAATVIDGDLTISIVPVGDHHYQLVHRGDRADTLDDPGTGSALARAFAARLDADGPAGAVTFHRTGDPASRATVPLDPVRLLGTEQSNSSLVLGDRMILKVLRRLQPGPHPEVEMLGALGARGCPGVPDLAGWYEIRGGPIDATLGVLQDFVSDGVDGWRLILDGLAIDPPRTLPLLRDLGVTLAGIHRVLGSATDDPAFRPVRIGPAMTAALTTSIADGAGALAARLAERPEIEQRPDLQELAAHLTEATHVAARVGDGLDPGPAIRHHGDLHLGQTLHTPRGWTIIDWEGEPARTLDERRAKQPALRDVAGLLRSLSYAAATHARSRGTVEPVGWRQAARAAVLDGYLAAADPGLLPAGAAATGRLLVLLELEKVVYEVGYELANRPDWLAIPAAGLRSLLEANRP